jgi:hypothetical protein
LGSTAFSSRFRNIAPTCGELAHGIDAADDIRAVRECDEPRARPEQGLEVPARELGRFGIHLPLAHDETFVREPRIGADVGLVVLVRDDDLVARLEVAAQRLGQDVGVLRRGGSEVQLVRSGVEPGGEPRPRGVHLLAGARGGRESVVRLDPGLAVVATEQVDRLAGGVGASRILEMGEAGERRLAKGRKLRADEVEVERHELFPRGDAIG